MKNADIFGKEYFLDHFYILWYNVFTSDTMMSIRRLSFLSVLMSWSGSRWIPTQHPLTKILVALKNNVIKCFTSQETGTYSEEIIEQFSYRKRYIKLCGKFKV